MVKTYIRC